MHTLDLLDAAPVADASHHVRAPGGYEWWYFDAEDAQRDVQVVAILLDGFVFHPGYLRAYDRYLRRPTRVAPPTAADFPCAYLVVYEGGRIASQFMMQYPGGSLRASGSSVDVSVGANRLWRDEQGALCLSLSGVPWSLTARGPVHHHGQSLSGELRFSPRIAHRPRERTFLSRAMTGAEHHWVVADPLCDVSATLRLGGVGSGDKSWTLTGRGYHDHNYGTGPLGPGLRRWIWGRAMFDDAVYTFHFARARDARLPDEAYLIRGDPTQGAVEDVPVAHVSADWSKWSPLGLAYPAQLRFDDAMVLSSPRLIDLAPFYMRLVYRCAVNGREGTAFCEVAYPHRLRWPVLGRMIEMSIHRAG